MRDDSIAEDSSTGGRSLSLVIPAYNEELRLEGLFSTLAADAEASTRAAGMCLEEILVVDDGSDDGTRRMLKEAAEGMPKLTPVFDLDRNRGKGAAFAAGVARARGDYVLLADVDLSTPLTELPKLSAAIARGADIAIGSRAVDGAVVERGPVHRKVLGKVFNGTVRLLTGLRLRDTQNGFKLLPTGATKRLLADQRCPGFSFDVELLMRAQRAGLRIVEVPVVYLHDPRSQVRVMRASLEMLRDVLGLSLRLRFGGRARQAPRSRLAKLPAEDAD